MPTSFSLTFDSSYNSLVLVAGEQIIDDVTELRITKTSNAAGYDCEVTRAGGGKLVAAASSAGKFAMARANGHESEVVPGFVEVNTEVENKMQLSVADDIARYMSRDQSSAS